jgi:hypothetical protein
MWPPHVIIKLQPENSPETSPQISPFNGLECLPDSTHPSSYKKPSPPSPFSPSFLSGLRRQAAAISRRDPLCLRPFPLKSDAPR